MAISKEYIDYLRGELSFWREVYIKKMFGGAGVYCDGLMFAAVFDDTLYFKVDETNIDKYKECGSPPLRLFKDKQKVPSFYQVPEEVFLDIDELVIWAEESLIIQKKLNGAL